jgi:hypothetical protein
MQRVDDRRVGVGFPEEEKDFLAYNGNTNQHWDLPSVLQNGLWGLFTPE